MTVLSFEILSQMWLGDEDISTNNDDEQVQQ